VTVLFENIASSSSYSCLHPDINYPADNLYHQFLYKRFQSTAAADTITISVPLIGADEQLANSLFWGYHNLTAMEIRIYDTGAHVLQTFTLAAPDQYGAVAWTEDDVTSIEIDVTTDAAAAFLGGVGFGVALTLPAPLAAWVEGRDDASIISESPYGQSGQNRIPALKKIKFDFQTTKAIAVACQDQADEVGVGGPLWVDAFGAAAVYMKPMYAKLTKSIEPAYDGKTWRFSLDLKECR